MNNADPNEAFKWTSKWLLAAQLLAESLFSKTEIAAKVGVSAVALGAWRKHPEFIAKVEELGNEFRTAVQAEGVAILSNRLAGYNDRWRKLNQVIQERARDAQMQGVPGGKTGMLAHTLKSIGAGEFATTIDVYEVDTGVLKELRSLEEQAARELGQWSDKTDITSKGGPLKFVIEGLSNAGWVPQQVIEQGKESA
jgi:Helix-turn-helix of insertion element transposase